MSAISGTVGAIMGSKAQKDAARQNLKAARETNAMNYRMFQEGRGSEGNAFLPLYFKDRERELSKDANAFYDSTKNLAGTPEEQFRRYSELIGGLRPAMEAGRGAVNDVFNGNLTENRTQWAQPVFQARKDFAATQGQAVMDALRERVNALNAENARKGFSGTGSFAQNRLLNSTIGARQGAASTMAGANLENAMDLRGIQDSGADLKLQMLNMPYTLAQNSLAAEMLPLSQVQQNFSRSLAPYEFFRMTPNSFQAAPLPMQAADTTWPAVMNSIGNVNKGLASAYLGGMFGGGGGGGAGVTGGFGGANWGAGMA